MIGFLVWNNLTQIPYWRESNFTESIDSHLESMEFFVSIENIITYSKSLITTFKIKYVVIGDLLYC